MATETDALALVYARSLYALAEEAGGLEKIYEVGGELEQICELGRADRAFAEFLASPIIETGRRGATLGRIFRDRVTDLTLRFLLVVNVKGRLNCLESIRAAFDLLVQEAHGRIEVDVFTAAPLDEAQLQSIGARIHQALGKEPVLHAYRDESMLGGLRLRIGDQLIDGSLATQLRRLKQNLDTAGPAAVRERLDRIIIDEDGP